MKTNEQWLDSLDNDRKAEFLYEVANNCCDVCTMSIAHTDTCYLYCKFRSKEGWKEWLKEEHKPVSTCIFNGYK